LGGGGGEKTEKATPKRRRDERKKGHVPLSRDAVSVLTMIGSFVMLSAMAGAMAEQMGDYFRYCMELARTDAAGLIPEPLGHLAMQAVMAALKTVGPIAGVTILCAVAATFAQTKLLVSTENLKPKFSRLNPLQGIKNLISLKSLIEVFKNILKIILLMILIYLSLKELIDHISGFLYTDIPASARVLFDEGMAMFTRITVAFVGVAAFDFFYQRWDYERQLKMSKQEIKEEYKQMEGDPQIKGKIKERQRKMAQNRMMQQVPEADVVVRNPTHFAVALRYKPERDNAPVVMAKGQDSLALRIVKVAEEHNIAVLENVPLARALYAGTEVNREIPPEFYAEVAEVLVYIFRLDADQNITK